ncbi:alkaline phosphatase D family protein [Saccharopolyspora shandongensis]|uniref:alkaline phosphatase D family protein n=1 Tax=Saccharopolyspora shandongensis TaxID=418495 RepID=UPI00343B9A34
MPEIPLPGRVSRRAVLLGGAAALGATALGGSALANRDRIAGAMADSAVRNGVVLTGDVHRHWAAEIKRTHDDPESRAVGTEFITTSVTSGGDGNDDGNGDVLKENPHVKFYANRRGYVRTKFTEAELRADYRVLPYVSKKDAPAETAKSFVVEDGNPVLNPT